MFSERASIRAFKSKWSVISISVQKGLETYVLSEFVVCNNRLACKKICIVVRIFMGCNNNALKHLEPVNGQCMLECFLLLTACFLW